MTAPSSATAEGIPSCAGACGPCSGVDDVLGLRRGRLGLLLPVLVVLVVLVAAATAFAWWRTTADDVAWSASVDGAREIDDLHRGRVLVRTDDGAAVLSAPGGTVEATLRPGPGRITAQLLTREGSAVVSLRDPVADHASVGVPAPDGGWRWHREFDEAQLVGLDPERKVAVVLDTARGLLVGMRADSGQQVWQHPATFVPTDEPDASALVLARVSSTGRWEARALRDGTLHATSAQAFSVDGSSLVQQEGDRCGTLRIRHETAQVEPDWGGLPVPAACSVHWLRDGYAYLTVDAGDDRRRLFALETESGRVSDLDLTLSPGALEDARESGAGRWLAVRDPGADVLRVLDARTGRAAWSQEWSRSWAARSGPETVLTLRDDGGEQVFELRDPDGAVLGRVKSQDRQWNDSAVGDGSETAVLLDDEVVVLR